MIRACFPLSLKYSPMAHPEYGAKYCRGAASEAVALTTIVYFIASTKCMRGNGKKSVSSSLFKVMAIPQDHLATGRLVWHSVLVND